VTDTPTATPSGPAVAPMLDHVQARRAIEALRAGVPSRDAVRALSAQQPQIESRFHQQLQALQQAAPEGRPSSGLLFAGDFGAGKSHLLTHLEQIALDENVVCSRVTISKEVPVFDPGRVFHAAVESMRVPRRNGSPLAEIADSLDVEGAEYAALGHWVGRPDVGLNSRFAATLYLYQQVKDPEVRDRIVAWWAGDPLTVGELRAWLRELGTNGTYRLERIAAAELALQRARFLARLIATAGYGGWTVLFDEIELIGRYSFKQRARSYAELGRWAGKSRLGSIPGIASVFAITIDFDAVVLQARGDSERIPGKLRATGAEADQLLATQAETGMRLIAREAIRLRGPDRDAIEKARQEVRALHGRAYQWDPPDMGVGERLSTTRMRQYVRRWINAWDLTRLYPGYSPATRATTLQTDYSERPDLELPAEPQPDPEGSA
jgi:P-loop Domain of unknown function (DUF2791)